LTAFLTPDIVGTVSTHPDPKGRPTSVIGLPDCQLYVAWDIVHGRLEPVDVRVEAYPGETVTAETLRAIPFGRLIAEKRRSQESLHRYVARHAAEPERVKEALRVADAAGANLEGVAALYREAHALGRSARQEIAEAFDISPSTAAKRIMAARKAGLLGPARPGKAGEA
jgi:hypothetical protein